MKTNKKTNHHTTPITLEAAYKRFWEAISTSPRTPMRTSNTIHSVAWSLWNMLAQHLDPRTLISGIFHDPSGLRAFYESQLLSEEAGLSLAYRAKLAQILIRFMRWAREHYALPSLPAFLNEKPKANLVRIESIPPSVVRDLLGVVLTNYPSFLCVVILMVFCGLRGSEAWAIAGDLRGCLRKDVLIVPSRRSRRGTKRVIRIRPATKAWFRFVPGIDDSQVTDFRPRNQVGKVLFFGMGMVGLAMVVRSTAALNKLPTDFLRRAWIEACLAVDTDRKKVMHEAGHGVDSVFDRHYPSAWTRDMAEEFWAIRPPEKPKE